MALFQRQLDAGEISTFEMAQARLQLDNIRLALADAARQQQDARARLATAVGVPVGGARRHRRWDSTRSTTCPADVPMRAARREALLNRADILGALSAYEASQSALQLEIARQYPDIHLGPGYQMDQDGQQVDAPALPGDVARVPSQPGPDCRGRGARARRRRPT